MSVFSSVKRHAGLMLDLYTAEDSGSSAINTSLELWKFTEMHTLLLLNGRY